MTKYIVLLTFDSSIYKGLTIPKGALLDEMFGILYYKKKPVLYIEDANLLCDKI